MSPIDFSDQHLNEAKRRLERFYNSFRIGSAIRHGDVLRGLSYKEEEELLPDIIDSILFQGV